MSTDELHEAILKRTLMLWDEKTKRNTLLSCSASYLVSFFCFGSFFVDHFLSTTIPLSQGWLQSVCLRVIACFPTATMSCIGHWRIWFNLIWLSIILEMLGSSAVVVLACFFSGQITLYSFFLPVFAFITALGSFFFKRQYIQDARELLRLRNDRSIVFIGELYDSEEP